jgi:hypothetical protein
LIRICLWKFFAFRDWGNICLQLCFRRARSVSYW